MKTWHKDLYRYEGENSSKLLVKLKYIFFVPGFTYTYFFRNSQSSFFGGALFRMFLKLNSYITHIQIPPQCQIGEGLYIGHFGSIIINPEAIIGRNFSIAAGTLVGNAQGKRKGTPTIGNNVYMGRNAIVIGGIKIGNNVLIAPGAFVNFDVPDNCIVVGNPGKIIQKESSPTAKYMVYTV